MSEFVDGVTHDGIHDRPRCVEVYIRPHKYPPTKKRPTYVVGAELEEDVGAGGVLEEVVEAHDVPVPERAVDAHLGLELLWEGGGYGQSAILFLRFVFTSSAVTITRTYIYTRKTYLLTGLALDQRRLLHDLDRERLARLQAGRPVALGEPALVVVLLCVSVCMYVC